MRPENNRPAIPHPNGQSKALRPQLDQSRPGWGKGGLRRVNSNDKALKNFCQAADKETLLVALAEAPFDSKYHHVLVALGDPRQSNKSFVRIIREHGVTMASLMSKYRDAKVAETHFQFQDGMPEIAAEIVVDAKPTMAMCPNCLGAGKVPDPLGRENKAGMIKRVRCQQCLGDKRVRVPGQTDARKIVLQSEGVLKTGAGVTVSTGIQVAVGGVPDLMAAIEVRERALAEPEVIEAEVIKDEDEE